MPNIRSAKFSLWARRFYTRITSILQIIVFYETFIKNYPQQPCGSTSKDIFGVHICLDMPAQMRDRAFDASGT